MYKFQTMIVKCYTQTKLKLNKHQNEQWSNEININISATLSTIPLLNSFHPFYKKRSNWYRLKLKTFNDHNIYEFDIIIKTILTFYTFLITNYLAKCLVSILSIFLLIFLRF